MSAKSKRISVVIDKRALNRYNNEISIINGEVAHLAELLRDNDKPCDNLSVLAVLFIGSGWLRSEAEKKLDAVTDPLVKTVLKDYIPQMPESFTDEIETIRKRVLGAVVEVSDILVPLRLLETDFAVIDGKLVVSPEHRTRFEQSITHELTPEEEDAYNTLATVIPELKRLKSRGWNIMPLLEGRIGRADWQNGVPGVEHLAEDILKYKLPYKRV